MKSGMLHQWLFWLGMIIVVGSHLYMLMYGLPANQMTMHAILNLVAAAMIGLTYYRKV